MYTIEYLVAPTIKINDKANVYLNLGLIIEKTRYIIINTKNSTGKV